MTAKEYLTQLRTLNFYVNEKYNDVKEIRAKITFLSAIDYSAVKVQTSTVGQDRNLELVARLADMEKEFAEAAIKAAETKALIIQQITAMQDQRYREVLCRRYVKFQPLEKIAAEMSYNYHWICHLHGEALQAFDKEYGISGKVRN